MCVCPSVCLCVCFIEPKWPGQRRPQPSREAACGPGAVRGAAPGRGSTSEACISALSIIPWIQGPGSLLPPRPDGRETAAESVLEIREVSAGLAAPGAAISCWTGLGKGRREKGSTWRKRALLSRATQGPVPLVVFFWGGVQIYFLKFILYCYFPSTLFLFSLCSMGTQLHIHAHIILSPIVVLRCEYPDIALSAPQQELTANPVQRQSLAPAPSSPSSPSLPLPPDPLWFMHSSRTVWFRDPGSLGTRDLL